MEELGGCGEVMVWRDGVKSGEGLGVWGALRSIPTVGSLQQHLMTPVLELR